ncbi:MAG: UDP-N-acetylmuramoyl-L-alanyl-D-glutamate--2,6-diaminopimelate ligase [Succinivibrionaceae bacterium]
MNMITLDYLLGFLNIDLPKVQVEYLSSNSRDIKPKTLFIALKGLNYDARKDIEKVVSLGAVAIVYEECNDVFVPQVMENVPCIACAKLKQKQAIIASRFFDCPSNKLQLIGVTGTNGKSTVTHLIAEWASLLGRKTALMGTLGNGFYPNLESTSNTTLDSLYLEKNINNFLSQGAESVAMEVSSHGIALGRISELKFSKVGFTNLSRDHLDFHKSMENYANTKFELLKKVDPKNCVINIDDSVGKEYFKLLPKALVYSTNKIDLPRAIYAKNIQFKQKGIAFDVDGLYGKEHFEIPLIGKFNVENVMCAIGLLLLEGFSLQKLAEVAHLLKAVSGRMECFKSDDSPLLIVDYAHTPDGLAKALDSLFLHNYGRVLCVCGCGGDRDVGKRPIMAQIACERSDFVIFTNDNPRTEDPKVIMDMMLKGVVEKNNYKVIFDRKTAIEEAYKMASTNDVILIAGKGHEDYQIIGKEKHYFSDRDIARNLVSEGLK